MLSNYTSSLKAAFENNKRQCGKPFRNFLYSRLRAHFWFAMEGTIIYLYYMATFVGLQDEPDRALLMATRAGKMELTWPLGTSGRRLPRKKVCTKACPSVLGRYGWILALFFFCLFMDLESVLLHKHTKTELGQYPAIVPTRLVNKPYIYCQTTKLRVDNTWNTEHCWVSRNIEYL